MVVVLFAYGESELTVCCVLFIKVTSNLCTLCFVVLGSNIMGVSITTNFIMGKIHIECLLALQLCCLLNATLFCCILMDSNWDGVGFVRMKEKSANSPLLVIDYDNFVVEGGVGFETTNALTIEDK